MLLGAAGIFASVGAAHASEVERGRALTQQWCGIFNAETTDERGQNMERPFEELAVRPHNDAVRLRAFLDEDHFPMTTLRLWEG
jgi:hypothetical protein